MSTSARRLARPAALARRLACAAALALLAGCGGPIPRDADGTLARVRAAHLFRLGLVDGVRLDPREAALLARVSRDANARPAPARGSQEALLLRLEAGGLDLVLGGRFAADTAWKTRVWLGPALAAAPAGAGRVEARPAARDGENGWIVLVQRRARALEVVP